MQQFSEATVTPLMSRENAGGSLSDEQGFIAHKGNHWIAIRKVANVWYNLNSTNITPPGPQFISDFQLDAFLSEHLEFGLHHFHREGITWVTIARAKTGIAPTEPPKSDVRQASDIYNHFQQNKSRALNFAGADEMELEAALKESMKTFDAEDRRTAAQGGGDESGGMVGSVLNRGGGAGGDQAQQPSFQAFQGKGVSLGAASGGDQQQMTDEEMAILANYEHDPEMAAAIL
eukprot:CAMPEP_0185585704 /NCGR_PEP_ID=MMETSP0434-20130131/40272_1 /TAXON_ID=626734 ORGANISM="Favella taraikaensis, Strain Fe Narragansett Bay" /NCGR_SAMPLE_ID=MMETSP0434 /ASSEMBLY_ACC=CAM_ASM_000379 /LENGTH=231 /DNA_ID=CAMNT_0028206215 /DNA_START=171 /DNA_END=866 /DNA_ORIENTATION=+